ncbi:hypothetical protein NQT62_14340 [Limnobacter humi]|uniref:Uncharacterized protein n=1 Tax=Limnobacter humi TaxID=1778671 RepID=A0ABT1WJD2_9BURK|nr:hypothetical protein [Limnobacter humi]MCQ8897617.1 hypothetical protein [Limnobacter humi]
MVHRCLSFNTWVRAALLVTTVCGIQTHAAVPEPVSLNAGQLGLPEVARPVDDFLRGDGLDGVDTLRDLKRAEGPFPFGKALLTIGQTQFLGLNPNLNSFDVSTLETPLGGDFPVDQETPVGFKRDKFNQFDRPLLRMHSTPPGSRSRAALGEWVY